MKIWTLYISHRHGGGIHGVYDTEAAAEAAVDAWVDEYWDDEVRKNWRYPHKKKPGDKAEAREFYFEVVEDESAEIEECNLADIEAERLLRAILPHAQSYADDWQTGLEDGTYEEKEGLEALQKALADAEALVGEVAHG
jgi:hypothetical protein